MTSQVMDLPHVPPQSSGHANHRIQSAPRAAGGRVATVLSAFRLRVPVPATVTA
jgi:hypothetical protein